MADMTEIAVASWRLEKWLDYVNVERKMAAKSALRAIKKYLSENNIEVIDLTGSKFDVGLAITVVNNESDETDEDKLIISEMVKPIIKENGAVIQYGQVILGDEVKKQKENNAVEKISVSEVKQSEETIVAAAEAVVAQEDSIAKDKQDVSTNDGKNNKRSLMGICIIGLQGLIIVIMLIAFIRIGNIASVNNQILADNQNKESVASDVEGSVDSSAIENSLISIDGRLDFMEEDIATLLEKYNESQSNNTGKEATGIEDSYIIYIVQSGDTLFKICQEHGIDFYANRALILKMNYMDNPNVIEVGQKLLLPKE